MGPLRSEDDRTAALAVPAQAAQRQPQVFVQRDQSAAPFLGCAIVQFDRGRNPTTRIQHHLPSDVGDFFRAEAGLDREQDQNAIAFGTRGSSGSLRP